MQIETFNCSNEAEWQEAIENNKDTYGSGVVRYAARWAHMMDNALAGGAELKDVAKSTSTSADVEGITAFMHGRAVSILSKAWVHGDELRRWHNLDTQIGNEGEKANEKGTTLNPVLLSIG
jgi:hypothetical protein